MLEISLPQLISALQKKEPYKLPTMNEGTKYLYENVYCRLLSGEDVRLHDIDFTFFEMADLHTFNDLYDVIFHKNSSQTDNIKNTLKKMAPACIQTSFI